MIKGPSRSERNAILRELKERERAAVTARRMPLSAIVTRSSERHHWSFTHARVTQLLVDATSFRFQCWTLDAALEVRLEVCFVLRTGPDRVDLDPGQPASLAPILSLLGCNLVTLTASSRGQLCMQFSDGREIHVTPQPDSVHPEYEAWRVEGEGFEDALYYECDVGGGQPWR